MLILYKKWQKCQICVIYENLGRYGHIATSHSVAVIFSAGQFYCHIFHTFGNIFTGICLSMGEEIR